ncbi:MAG: hypothetical protein IKP86_02975 [Anaerolineaceae bacterium]|nr:hypothetical protein [Anaerolineaceae bacterium]
MKRTLQNILYILPFFGGIITLFIILAEHSEEKNAWLFGFSKMRLLLAGTMLVLCVFSFLVFMFRKKNLKYLYYLSGAMGIFAGELLLFVRFPADGTGNMLPVFTDRTKPLLVWMLASGVIWLAALRWTEKQRPGGWIISLSGAAAAVYLVISTYLDRKCWNLDLPGNVPFTAAAWLSFVVWLAVLKSDTPRGWKTAAGCLFFLCAGFSITRITGMWMGRVHTHLGSYWNELAESFLHGRLDLMHPGGYHDLTMYEGKWYVPNPPMPGILLIPWAALLGSAYKINMPVYSALIAGINTALFFLMLILAYTREGGPLYMSGTDGTSYPGRSLSVSVWVTVLFVFGSAHFWLGTTGQMWFISQLLVVTFTLLACICVISGFAPVWAGIALGCGVMCRPNIFPVWLCLLALRLYQMRPFPYVNWKKTIMWSLASGIPVVISAGFLLLYNKLRFNDWFDFGYVTINGAEWILDSVGEYGMFHPHFLKINARVMFFELPRLDFSGERFFFYPYVAGYSMFVMTPPLVYIFRSFRKDWFSAGTWASVLLSVGLLLLYHNTGAEQVGYRYMLDIAAPLALLMAAGMKGKTGKLFKALTIFAIAESFAGIYWWYMGRI